MSRSRSMIWSTRSRNSSRSSDSCSGWLMVVVLFFSIFYAPGVSTHRSHRSQTIWRGPRYRTGRRGELAQRVELLVVGVALFRRSIVNRRPDHRRIRQTATRAGTTGPACDRLSPRSQPRSLPSQLGSVSGSLKRRNNRGVRAEKQRLDAECERYENSDDTGRNSW